MTIPSNHEMGDEVWFLNFNELKIKKGGIQRPFTIFSNRTIEWEIEVWDKNYKSSTFMVMDDKCFKTKEELINYLTEE